MEYGKAQAGMPAHVIGMMQQAQEVAAQYPGVPQSAGILQQTRLNIEACHQLIGDMHKFADQYVGIRNESQKPEAPSPVPNGQAEELRDAAAYLHQRIRAVCDRLSVL